MNKILIYYVYYEMIWGGKYVLASASSDRAKNWNLDDHEQNLIYYIYYEMIWGGKYVLAATNSDWAKNWNLDDLQQNTSWSNDLKYQFIDFVAKRCKILVLYTPFFFPYFISH